MVHNDNPNGQEYARGYRAGLRDGEKATLRKVADTTKALAKLHVGADGSSSGSPNTPGSSDTPERLREKAYLQGRRDAISELFASGGIGRAQMGLAVLYMLPEAFLAAYERVFEAALPGATAALGAKSGKGLDTDGSGQSRDVGKSSGRKTTGIVLGSETNLQVQGGGKRWKPAPTGGIGSDAALELKTKADRVLVSLTHELERQITTEGAIRKSGKSGARGNGGGSQSGSSRCAGCGSFMKSEWGWCPRCGTGRTLR